VARDPFFYLRWAAATVILIVWTVSVGFSLFAKQPIDSWVHVMAAAIVTALFGKEVWRRDGDDDDKQGGKHVR
jgi:uncharacterized membrane protein